MIQIKFAKPYTYFWDVVRKVVKGERVDGDEFNLVGGRKSAKTTTLILLWAALSLLAPDDVGFICFRNYQNSAKDMFEDTIEILEAYEIPYKSIKNRLAITVNGNTIRFVGLNSNTKTKSAKKAGLPRFGNVKYGFMFFEERFEFEERDVRSAIEAVRSIGNQETQYILLNACNPWAMGSEYIKYCSKIQTWNINILKETGSQIGRYEVPVGEGKTKTVIMHYTNWRANKEFLGESEILSILDTWNFDKRRAATTDWGLPGYEDGAIYTHLLNNLGKAIYQEHTWLYGGGDYGWGRNANTGQTAFLFMGISLESGIDIYGEYIQDNHNIVKSPDMVAKEVVLFYVNQMRDYCNRVGWASPFNLTVRVDNMNVGFIQLLNKEAQEKSVYWLRFVKCSKFPVQDRIEIVLSIMYQHKLRLGENVKVLKQEMELAHYEDNDTQKRVKKHDHCLNAFEYGIENVMYKFATEHNIINLKKKIGKIW